MDQPVVRPRPSYFPKNIVPSRSWPSDQDGWPRMLHVVDHAHLALVAPTPVPLRRRLRRRFGFPWPESGSQGTRNSSLLGEERSLVLLGDDGALSRITLPPPASSTPPSIDSAEISPRIWPEVKSYLSFLWLIQKALFQLLRQSLLLLQTKLGKRKQGCITLCTMNPMIQAEAPSIPTEAAATL
uniref:Uncharacterized protein n=1 Tax=Oryza brachyantha TaxID=4533 RepID=J3N4X4_ORYBR